MSKREVGRTFKLILKTLETSVDVITSENFMSRFCSNLGLSNKIQKAATIIAKNAHDLDLCGGCVTSHTQSLLKVFQFISCHLVSVGEAQSRSQLQLFSWRLKRQTTRRRRKVRDGYFNVGSTPAFTAGARFVLQTSATSLELQRRPFVSLTKCCDRERMFSSRKTSTSSLRFISCRYEAAHLAFTRTHNSTQSQE